MSVDECLHVFRLYAKGWELSKRIGAVACFARRYHRG